MAAAIDETAKAHASTCDLTHPGTPAAAVGIVQVDNDVLNYLVLGDVTLVIETTEGLRIVTDNRVNATASAERAAADVLPNGSREKTAALVRMKHAELAARNVLGGFWVAAADPEAVSEALVGAVPLLGTCGAALLTDGAARAVLPFKIYDWPGMLQALKTFGPSGVITQIREVENIDPAGIERPRNKIHDDATVAIINMTHSGKTRVN